VPASEPPSGSPPDQPSTENLTSRTQEDATGTSKPPHPATC